MELDFPAAFGDGGALAETEMNWKAQEDALAR